MKASESLDLQARTAGRRLYLAAAVVLLAFGPLWRAHLLDPLIFTVGLLAALCGLLVMALRGIRCPRCAGNLAIFPRGRSMGAIKYCPFCALGMDEEIGDPAAGRQAPAE
jgi:hypothetical protein